MLTQARLAITTQFNLNLKNSPSPNKNNDNNPSILSPFKIKNMQDLESLDDGSITTERRYIYIIFKYFL